MTQVLWGGGRLLEVVLTLADVHDHLRVPQLREIPNVPEEREGAHNAVGAGRRAQRRGKGAQPRSAREEGAAPHLCAQ